MESERTTRARIPSAAPATAECGLSIVIPNYNHGRYLSHAIRSRLQQTIPPLEVIVVDDASTDDSIDIIERESARDPRVHLVRRPENGGPNAAIASGLAVARGEFITFSAADDLIEPRFVEQAITTLQQFPQAALCFMDPCMVHDVTELRQSVPLALANTPAYFSPDEFERLMRDNYFTISSNTVVYRRSCVARIGGFRADLEWQADWLANLVLAFRHGACYVPESLATWRLRPGSYSWLGLRQRQGQRRLLYRCLDVLAQDYTDVAGHFRRAALVPEMRLRVLPWLLASPRHRGHITSRLAARLVARELWTLVRPVFPLRVRQWWRRRSGDIKPSA